MKLSEPVRVACTRKGTAMKSSSAEKLVAPLAWWAIVWAVLLAVGECARNWGDWQWWPFWLLDFIASALLLVGAWFALRPNQGKCLSPLVGALGFCTAGAYGSFFSHLEVMEQPVSGNFAHGPLTVIIGVLFGLATASFLVSTAVAVRLSR
jgi:hypothetical protein